MAGAWYLSPVLAFLFHNILATEISDTVSYCWHGNIEFQRTLRNETCATGKISLPDIRDSASASTHSPPLPQNLTQVTADDGLSMSSVTHCMVFQYMRHTELGVKDDYRTYETSIYANYTCDYTDLCHSADNKWLYNVTYQGVHGNVYCCSKNNCNIHVRGVPPQQQLCYQASNTTLKPTGRLMSCLASGAICAHTTWIRDTDGEKVSSYFCDNSYRCQSNGLTETYSSCKMVRKRDTNNNKMEELCCCSDNKCNIPPWPVSDPNNRNMETGQDATLHWVIAGSVILLTFCVGVGAGVAVAVVRNRKKTRGDNHMAMTYRRIAADEASGTGDEDHLIT